MSDTFSITLRQEQDYRFVVEFDQPGVERLLVDEPAPLGESAGPNASRLLAAAVANCLSASLLFCMRKARLQPGGISTTVEGTVERDERNRFRIGGLHVTIHPTLGPEDAARVERCVDIFEDFCIVTESVRKGIDVVVDVEPLVAEGGVVPELAGTGA
ncbi:MAG TPA: OsmC family protein [Longimicrobiales bacterium]|nr:OsmC family protein [Longimicrobiales bacterium]